MSDTRATALPAHRQAELLARARARRAATGASEGEAPPGGARLAPAQQGIWMVEQLDPGTTQHNHSEFFRLTGALDVTALAAALDRVAGRHAVLRTCYRRHGAAIAAVTLEGGFPMLRLDDADTPETLLRHARAEIELPFDLAGQWPARARLIWLGDDRWLLGITTHHLAYDGQSHAILLEELSGHYRALTGGAPYDPRPAPDYFALGERHRARLDAGRCAAAQRFWRDYLADCPPAPGAEGTVANPGELAAARLEFALGEARSLAVAATARAAGATGFSVLIAAFHRALAERERRDDLCIGTVATGRTDEASERVIGLFSNPLPIRLRSPAAAAPRERVHEAFEQLAAVLEWQDVPLAQALAGATARQALPFAATIGFTAASCAAQLRLEGMQVEPIPGEVAQATFPLQLFVTGSADRLAGEFVYRRARYEAAEIAALRDAFLVALERLTGTSAPGPLSGRRAPLGGGRLLADIGPLFGDASPVRALRASRELADAAALDGAAAAVRERVAAEGAVLMRGAMLDDAGLAALAQAVAGSVAAYDEGSSPRRRFGSGVYSSTEYPAPLPISLHSEMSYAAHWPACLVFQCRVAAARGGETPLADTAALLAALPPELVARFEARGVRYRRRLRDGPGPGLSWREVFECNDRAEVEARCRAEAIDVHWDADGALVTAQDRPATIVHPAAGTRHWFNQADQWHPSNHPPALAAAIRALPAGERPVDAGYADGTEIADEAIATIRAAQERLALTFDWQPGDVLVVDNMRFAHGRRPFEGRRDIRVVLGGGVRLADVVSAPAPAHPA